MFDTVAYMGASNFVTRLPPREAVNNDVLNAPIHACVYNMLTRT